MSRRLSAAIFFLALMQAAYAGAQAPKPDAELMQYLRQSIRLRDTQIAELESGRTVVRAMPAHAKDEIYLFGAIYIDAAPESYARLAENMDAIRKLAGSISVGTIGNPPTINNFTGFDLDAEDVASLKSCRVGDCTVQLSQPAIEGLRKVDWNAADVNARVNLYLQQTVMQILADYKRSGNAALGSYADRTPPTDVAREFADMVKDEDALPQSMRGFTDALLQYPAKQPTNSREMIYWSKVKFGFKPTLRVVQEVTLRNPTGDRIPVVVARKQLYASHYFKTALDTSFCVQQPGQHGFYLVILLSSEIKLEGMYGALLHAIGVNRSQVELERMLQTVKTTLEAGR